MPSSKVVRNAALSLLVAVVTAALTALALTTLSPQASANPISTQATEDCWIDVDWSKKSGVWSAHSTLRCSGVSMGAAVELVTGGPLQTKSWSTSEVKKLATSLPTLKIKDKKGKQTWCVQSLTRLIFSAGYFTVTNAGKHCIVG